MANRAPLTTSVNRNSLADGRNIQQYSGIQHSFAAHAMTEAVQNLKTGYYVALGFVLAVVAFLRGHYLLGLDAGVAYALVAASVVWLVTRNVRKAPQPVQVLAFIVTVFPIGFVLAFPETINPDVGHFIAKQETDRNVRSELIVVFDSAKDFSHLSIETTHVKVVNVTIVGELPNRGRWQALREQILAECPTLSLCPLHWDLEIQGEAIQGLDSELFPPPDSAA